MNIIEVSKFHQVKAFTNYRPNIWFCYPAKFTLSDYWINNFGAPDQSIDFTIIINSFRRDFNVSYFSVDTLNDCIAQEKSFYWDNENQALYVHMEHDQAPYTAVWQYGTFYGFSEDRILYLTDQEYSPALLSSPRVTQQEDIVNSSRLSLMRGSAVLNNMPTNEFKGLNDHFITQKTYGNDVFVYYLPDDKVSQYGDGDRSDLIPVGAFYVEDYDISLKRMPIRLQDKRKAFDITIPNEYFLESNYPNIDDIDGRVIPLMYGQVRDAKAIPTNKILTSGDVDYRVAILLSSVGIVQVKIDEVWTTKTPINVNLDTGEFSLSSADGRNSNGGLYDCRVVDPIGIPITYLSDIIKDIENRYLGIEYIDSLYNITEWEAEEIKLSSGGWVFESEILFYDAVALIQGGSTKRFRYEIQPNGKRTIRVDDINREVSGTIEPSDIQNRDDIPVTTDSKQVFASINVLHSKSFNSNVFKKKQNSDNKNYVLANYGSSKSLPANTMINNNTDADTRGVNDSGKFKDIPQIMTLNLMGEHFLNVRIYDTYNIAATPGFVNLDAGSEDLLIDNKVVNDGKFIIADYQDNGYGAGIYGSSDILKYVLNSEQKSISFSMVNFLASASWTKTTIMKSEGTISLRMSHQLEFLYMEILKPDWTYSAHGPFDIDSIITISDDGEYFNFYENNVLKSSTNNVKYRFSGQDIEIIGNANVQFDITQMLVSNGVLEGFKEGYIFKEQKIITGREYYGLTKGQVVGIDPDTNNLTNNVKFKLIEQQ